MRLLAVALLFVTALHAQRGMGGFGRGGMGGVGRAGFQGRGSFGGHGRWAGGGGGYRGGSGFHGRPGRGFVGGGYYGGGYYRGGFGYGRSFYGYGRSLYGSGYGGIWGGYYPSGWYSTPFWSTPFAASDPYPYNTGPTIIIVTVPAATAESSSTAVDLNQTSSYRPAFSYPPSATSYPPAARYRPAAYAPVPESAENRSLVTKSWAYLIAAKDGTIWLAREYRVEGGMLHFATKGDHSKRLPLADVNGSLTEQLNRERGVAVYLR